MGGACELLVCAYARALMIARANFNVTKFSPCKKIWGKIFANGMHWRNWQKFSPGKNFRVYGIRTVHNIIVLLLLKFK